MKQFLLYCLLVICSLSTAHSQDTLPLKYFDTKLELMDSKDSAAAMYHGICERGARQLFVVTFYDAKEVKIATISYANKDLTVKDGEITGYYENGDEQFTGNYSNNNLNGPWMTWYPDGQHCDSGKFKNNIPDGVWMSWYPNGQLRLGVELSAKRYVEVQEELHKLSKHSSSGQQSASQIRFGSSVFYEENTCKLLQQSLQPAEIIGNSLRLCLKTKVDHNSITGFTYDVDYAPPFTQCLIHGAYKSFFPDGTVKNCGYYDYGLRTGNWEEVNEEDGIRSSGAYKKGVRIGEWRHYSRFDRLMSVHWYP